MRNDLKVITGIILLMYSSSSVSAMAAEKKSEAAGEGSGLLKEFHLSSASLQTPKKKFDHHTDEIVNLVFVPRKSVQIAESRWYDPSDKEFRIIRHVYDRSKEAKKAIERPKGGVTRVHHIPTKELYDHKPGLWKVALYIDNQLPLRQTFLVTRMRTRGRCKTKAGTQAGMVHERRSRPAQQDCTR
jgi:hypothetical protein